MQNNIKTFDKLTDMDILSMLKRKHFDIEYSFNIPTNQGTIQQNLADNDDYRTNTLSLTTQIFDVDILYIYLKNYYLNKYLADEDVKIDVYASYYKEADKVTNIKDYFFKEYANSKGVIEQDIKIITTKQMEEFLNFMVSQIVMYIVINNPSNYVRKLIVNGIYVEQSIKGTSNMDMDDYLG